MSEEYPTSHKSELDKLEQKALRLGWNIPADVKRRVVERQVEIATSETSEDRQATAAARVLTTMNAQDIQLETGIDAPDASAEPVDPLEIIKAMRGMTTPGDE